MKKQNKNALRWIVNSSRPQLFNIIFLAAVYGLNAFIGVYNTVFAKNLVDAATQRGDLNQVIYYALMYLGVTVVQIVTLVLARIFSFKVSAKLEMSMKSRLFSDMMDKGYSEITAYHSGELMNRLTSDVSVISSAVTSIYSERCVFYRKNRRHFLYLNQH